jgi:two-component system, OmpR family, response regulator MtrA
MQQIQVLCVDDDPTTLELIRVILDRSLIKMYSAENGKAALEAWSRQPVDLIILDVMMPVMDGLETLRHIRQVSDIPVILLTAKDQEVDIIAGFAAGASDYIDKPFTPGELVARIEARIKLNRRDGHKESLLLEYSGLSLDGKACTVKCNDQPVNLTALEFRLLHYLMAHAGVMVSKYELANSVWGYKHSPVDLNLVEATISRMRKKIQNKPGSPEYISTVRGLGYRFGGEENDGGGRLLQQ